MRALATFFAVMNILRAFQLLFWVAAILFAVHVSMLVKTEVESVLTGFKSSVGGVGGFGSIAAGASPDIGDVARDMTSGLRGVTDRLGRGVSGGHGGGIYNNVVR